MGDSQHKALAILKKWDKHYSADAIGASIFNTCVGDFYNMIWDNKFDIQGAALALPSYDRTEKLLLTEPGSKWFDNIHTPEKETCADIINQSFKLTVYEMLRKHGKPGKKWQWGLIKKTYINHLANLPGFGTGEFYAGGASGVINALRNGNGPSWRMVVQMGPTVKGYGVFPGGESGNPGSFYYNDMFKTWKQGKLNELLFLNSATEKSARIKSTLTLK